MRFNILGDFTTESGLGNILKIFSETRYRDFFSSKSYGGDLSGITVVLMCQDPALNLKQRIRYSKEEQKIYVDIMLDLSEVVKMDPRSLKEMVAKKLVDETLHILGKYNPENFNIQEFESDLRAIFLNSARSAI